MTDTTTLHESPLGLFVATLQDVGRNVFIAGFSADGQFALVVDDDNERCSVANVDSVGSSLGRWECSVNHRHHFAGLYAQRFPLR